MIKGQSLQRGFEMNGSVLIRCFEKSIPEEVFKAHRSQESQASLVVLPNATSIHEISEFHPPVHKAE